METGVMAREATGATTGALGAAVATEVEDIQGATETTGKKFGQDPKISPTARDIKTFFFPPQGTGRI